MPVCYRVYIEKSCVLFLLPYDRLTRKADSSRRVTDRWTWDGYAGVPSTRRRIRIFKIRYICIDNALRDSFNFRVCPCVWKASKNCNNDLSCAGFDRCFVVSVTGYRTFDSFGFIDSFRCILDTFSGVPLEKSHTDGTKEYRLHCNCDFSRSLSTAIAKIGFSLHVHACQNFVISTPTVKREIERETTGNSEKNLN